MSNASKCWFASPFTLHGKPVSFNVLETIKEDERSYILSGGHFSKHKCSVLFTSSNEKVVTVIVYEKQERLLLLLRGVLVGEDDASDKYLFEGILIYYINKKHATGSKHGQFLWVDRMWKFMQCKDDKDIEMKNGDIKLRSIDNLTNGHE